jgi:hypothetical protein
VPRPSRVRACAWVNRLGHCLSTATHHSPNTTVDYTIIGLKWWTEGLFPQVEVVMRVPAALLPSGRTGVSAMGRGLRPQSLDPRRVCAKGVRKEDYVWLSEWKLSNSFANNSLGRLPDSALATSSSVRRPVESKARACSRQDAATPNGREGRARSPRDCYEYQSGRRRTRRFRSATVRYWRRRDSERRMAPPAFEARSGLPGCSG